MGIYTKVEGGTGAGSKRAGRSAPKSDWKCKKGHKCKFYWLNCPTCFQPRD